MSSSPGKKQLLAFQLDRQRFALPLRDVERVVRAVEILPLPGAPGSVLGAINVGGCVVPVFCAGGARGLPPRGIDPGQQLVLAHAGLRIVAMLADEVSGIIDCGAHEIVPTDAIMDGLERFHGVAALADGMVLIHDLEKFLSRDEAAQLGQALELAE